MHRRLFLKQSSLGAAGCALATPARPRHTEHLIFIVNGGGARKKDYYENDSLCPNIRKIASEGFVFEEDHCERIASHNAAFRELLTGHEWLDDGPAYPNIFDYFGRNTAIVIRPSLGAMMKSTTAANYITPRASIVPTAWPVFFGDRISLRVWIARP